MLHTRGKLKSVFSATLTVKVPLICSSIFSILMSYGYRNSPAQFHDIISWAGAESSSKQQAQNYMPYHFPG